MLAVITTWAGEMPLKIKIARSHSEPIGKIVADRKLRIKRDGRPGDSVIVCRSSMLAGNYPKMTALAIVKARGLKN